MKESPPTRPSAQIIAFPARLRHEEPRVADLEEMLATQAHEAAGLDWKAAVDLLEGAAEMIRSAWAFDEPGFAAAQAKRLSDFYFEEAADCRKLAANCKADDESRAHFEAKAAEHEARARSFAAEAKDGV